MRIFCRIASFVVAAYFIICAAAAFCGYDFPTFTVGMFFALFAAEMIMNGVFGFKKPPKTVKFKNLLTLKNGETQVFCSDLSIRAKDGAFGPEDVKSLYSEIAEDFEHE